MKLIEVTTPQDEQAFLTLPVQLHRNDPYWIRPLDDEITKVFDPIQNKLFRHGEAIRWILYDGQMTLIGRVAAFIDHKVCNNHEQPTGGMGFFECINSDEAAFLLFDACRDWLKQRGMEAMDGPVNFGDRDKWWGLLVDGFSPPNFCMPYNPRYYQHLFESYGFLNYFNQFTFHRYFDEKGLDPYMQTAADRIAENPSYRISHIEKGNTDRYANEFMEVYNSAWSRHTGIKPITLTHAKALLKSLKPIMDRRLVWFAYYEDEPVGFFIMIPEMNQVFRHLNGKLNLIGKLKFLWYFKVRRVVTTAVGVIFGVSSEHQRKGVEGAIVSAFNNYVRQQGVPYKELELNWIGDFNPTMIRIAKMVGCQVKKTHTTYRYLFDREKPFTRAKRLG